MASYNFDDRNIKLRCSRWFHARARMNTKQLVAGIVALPLLASVAMAGQPALLSDAHLDRVTAGSATDLNTQLQILLHEAVSDQAHYGAIISNVLKSFGAVSSSILGNIKN